MEKLGQKYLWGRNDALDLVYAHLKKKAGWQI